jgi:hypothetical protein
MSDNTTKAPDDTSRGPEHIAHHLDVSERHVRDIRREDETVPPVGPPDRTEAEGAGAGLTIAR